MRDENQLLAPFSYITKTPGKQLRRNLAAALNVWLGVDENSLEVIVSAIEMLHNASLMIDDIEDSSPMRRGQPVAHSVYGVPRTINTANYVIFLALRKLLELKNDKVAEIFVDQMLKLHRGQGKDIYWRDELLCPTEEEYEEMVKQKTGGLFWMILQLMELFSAKNSFNFSSLIDDLATYFQIRDDYLNLCSCEYEKQKSFAEDLSEGKFSFPIIAALKGRAENDEVLDILRKRTTDVEVKLKCVQIIQERGALRYTFGKLIKLYEKILTEIDRLGGNDQLKSLVTSLHKDLIICQ